MTPLQSTALVGGRGNRPGLPSVDQAFGAYVALGRDRSLEKVRIALANETPPLKVSIKTLKRWSKAEGWLARAEAEDRRIKSQTGAKIAERVAETIASAATRLGISHGYILESLKNIAERCQQAEPVLDAEGNPTGEYRFDAKGAIQALKLMGDTIATFGASTTPPPPPGPVTNNTLIVADVGAEIRDLLRQYDPLAAKTINAEGS